MWTKESIQQLLATNDLAVERAIVAIYDRQTQDEKQDSDTKHDNSRGFRSNHASTGSYFARIILKGWKQDRLARRQRRVHLNPNKLAKARKIAMQYHRQLCEVANAAEIDKQEDERERRKSSFLGNETAEEAERMMQRMEAQGDREQTRREEQAKEEFKRRVEGPMPGTYGLHGSHAC